jgi:hypothetical protein
LYLGPISTTNEEVMGGIHQRLEKIKQIKLESNVRVHKIGKQICVTKFDGYHIVKNKDFPALANFIKLLFTSSSNGNNIANSNKTSISYNNSKFTLVQVLLTKFGTILTTII